MRSMQQKQTGEIRVRRQFNVNSGLQHRRGVLLLIVVSMLTLFLMLGTAYIVTASRARESARALSRKTLFADQLNYRPETYLDEVLMRVVRGGPIVGLPTPIGSGLAPSFESLLEDRYGPVFLSGSVDSPAIYSGAGAGNTGPVITVDFAPVVGGPTPHPAELNGLVLTLTADGKPSTSHRIVRAYAAGSGYSLALTNPRSPHQWTGTTISDFSGNAIINGREFSGAGAPNEAWDGFDSDNPFLAQVEPGSTVSRTTVVRPSFFNATDWSDPAADIDGDGQPDNNPALDTDGIDCDADGILDSADNDGDGVSDGVFLEWGFAPLPAAAGDVRLHASALIVDLDGRFNVNAHGSLVNSPTRINLPLRQASPANSLYTPVNGDTRWTGDVAFDMVPMGSGVGPAEINPFHVFSQYATAAAGAPVGSDEEAAVYTLAGGPQTETAGGLRPATSRYSTSQKTPRLPPLEGRYGGQGSTWSTLSTITSRRLADSTLGLVLPVRSSQMLRAASQAARLVSDYELFVQKNVSANNGVPPLWWNTSNASFNWLAGQAGLPSPRAIYSSPPDLHGRMKTLTRDRLWEVAIDLNGDGDTNDPGETPPGGASDKDGDGRETYGLVPRLAYAKPEWSTAANPAAETDGNPYEVQLSSVETKGGYLHAPSTDGTSTASPMAGNPFTFGELEALLRPYDVDVNLLPPRLAAMLGTVAEQMRTRLTTESWDTTAITDGSAAGAWRRITDAIQANVSATDAATLYGNSPREGILSGEIARGERFNLNRPLTGELQNQYNASDLYYVQRQAYFKDIYTLLVLLDDDPTNLTAAELAKLAQYAANVVEFRDADSTMSPFEYDTDIFNGWDVDGDVTTNDGGSERGDIIWGAERPEIVIASGVGWESSDGGDHGEIYISLHRPWHDKALAAVATQIAGNPIDVALDVTEDINGNGSLDVGEDLNGDGSLDAGQPEDAVLLSRKRDGSSYPVWRIRLSDGATDDFIPIQQPGGWSISPKLGADDWIGIRISDLDDSSTITSRNLTFPDFQLRDHDNDGGTTPLEPLTLSSANFPGPGGTRGVVGQDRLLTVHLERLSCPRHDGDANWSKSGDATDSGSTGYLSAARYVTVDSMQIVIVSCTDDPAMTIAEPADDQIRAMENLRDHDLANEAFWRMADAPSGHRTTPDQPTTLGSAAGDLGVVPPFTNQVNAYPWPNRPFFSPVELLLVHDDSPQEMLSDRVADDEGYRTLLTTAPTTDLPTPLLLDSVTITTPFTGIHNSWVDSSYHLADETGLHPETHPVNQLSAYREPGRVNVNTITNNQVWDAVIAGPLAVEDPDRDDQVEYDFDDDGSSIPHSHPVIERVTRTNNQGEKVAGADLQNTPAETLQEMLVVGGTGLVHFDSDGSYYNAVDVDLNPLHKIYTASRLANTATVRSNVFAIWVTLRESISGDPDSVKYHRAFYIVDRSIPVGFESGEDHNVCDVIRLRRIIE